jgi:hypothetical protein
LAIEAKCAECIICRDRSALQFGNFSELFATPSRIAGLKAPICTHLRCSVHREQSHGKPIGAERLRCLNVSVADVRREGHGLLRTAAIFSNLAFIAYGTIEWLPPVLFLHLVLLPLNIARLSEIVRAQSNGAVRTQTLCIDVLGPRPHTNRVLTRSRSPCQTRRDQAARLPDDCGLKIGQPGAT